MSAIQFKIFDEFAGQTGWNMRMEQGQWALVEKHATDIIHAEKLVQSSRCREFSWLARFKILLLSLWKMLTLKIASIYLLYIITI